MRKLHFWCYCTVIYRWNSLIHECFHFFIFLLDDDDVTTSGVTLDDVDKRVIFLNRPQPQKFSTNHISTAKYRLVFVLCSRAQCIQFSIFRMSHRKPILIYCNCIHIWLFLQLHQLFAIVSVRTISSIFKLFFPIYRSTSTNTWCFTNRTIHNISSTNIYFSCKRHQRDGRRFREYQQFVACRWLVTFIK